MGGEFEGKMDACICMAESLYCPPETIIILLTGYISIYNKMFFKKKRAIHWNVDGHPILMLGEVKKNVILICGFGTFHHIKVPYR